MLRVPACVVAPLVFCSPTLGKSGQLGSPYFVVLGTIEPRKNHMSLLHLWPQFVDELGDAAPRLIVVGEHG